MANGLHVSIKLIDLTMTSYTVVSSIAVTLLGDMADMLGGCPVHLALLTSKMLQCWPGITDFVS